MTHATCHPDRRRLARGLCSPCYWRQHRGVGQPDPSAEYPMGHRDYDDDALRAAWEAAEPAKPGERMQFWDRLGMALERSGSAVYRHARRIGLPAKMEERS